MKMDRRTFLVSSGAAAASMLGARAAGHPNVLLILADDLGFSDLGCYGGEMRTPNLDGLAAQGLRFAQHYSTGRCWPSRACLLTGYYAQQVRRDTMPGVQRGDRPAWAPLLPVFLKPHGYRAYHSGKWHLDGMPIESGFDRSYYVLDQDRFFSPTKHWEDDVPLPQPERDSGYYATRAIAEHAIRTLKEHAAAHREKPFFHYLAFTSPHFPLQALQADIARCAGRYDAGWDAVRERRWRRLTEMGIVNSPLPPLDPDTKPNNLEEEELQARIDPGEAGSAVLWDTLTAEQRRFQSVKMSIHAAMVERMDAEIGRVVEQLREMSAFENTLILFMADNGASAEQIIRGDGHDKNALPGSAGSYLCLGPGWASAANSPFRLYKSYTHEGGISSPLIAHWPEGFAARGEIRRGATHFIDVLPTVLDVCGAAKPDTWLGQALPPTPGRSLSAAFRGEATPTHPSLWWCHMNRPAIQAGDWKLVSLGLDGPWELYDLRSDRSEMKNLAEEYPEKVSALRAEWERMAEEFRNKLAE